VSEETTETWGKFVGCYESDDKSPAFIQLQCVSGLSEQVLAYDRRDIGRFILP